MSESPFLDNRERIFENSVGFVIFDKFPVSKGHCLIIPNRVYSDYFDSSEEEIIGLDISEHQEEAYAGFQIFTVE